MSIDISFAYLLVYLLVFVRLTGMIVLNPFLGRSNIPAMVRVGLAVFMAFLIAPLQPQADLLMVQQMSDIEFLFAMVRELAVGLIYGYVFQIFYYFLFFVGDLIDTDIGLSMAKTFDPATSIQVSFSSSLVTILFALYFFVTNSHLALLYLFAGSFEAIPLGASTLSTDIITFALKLFSQIFLLALRLAAPFMVAEFVLQAAMGILMRFIPQITVFVINFQLRITLGLLMLFLFAPFIGQFIDNYITVLFDNLVDATALMGGG